MRNLAALLLIFSFLSCSDDTKKVMTVSGSIDGLKKGTLFLQNVKDSVLVNIDSLEIKGNGTFFFECAIESPEIFYLYLRKADNNDFNDRITFFGEEGAITINTAWNQFESKAEVLGSKSQGTFESYREILSNFNKRDLELAQLALSAGDSINVDSVEALAETNYRNRFKYIVNFGLTNPTSYVTPYIAITDGKDANPIYLDSIYKTLPDSIATSKYGKALKMIVEGK